MAKTAEEYLPLTESAYLILASLTEPCHGYGIMQQTATAGGNKLGPGTLYTALGKLMEYGLIRLSGESGTGGGERRKFYCLTPLGLEVVVLESRRLAALADWGRKRLEKTGATP